VTNPPPSSSPPRPILLVHKSTQQAHRLDEVVDILKREVGDDLVVGVSVSLGNQTPTEARRFLQRFNTLFTRVDLYLVDPAISAHPDQLGGSINLLDRVPYLRGWPTKPSRRRIRAVLDQQRDLGATALLTPTGLVRDTNADEELDRALAWVRATRDLEPLAPLLVNMTLPATWLADPDLRYKLLLELVESPEPRWYLRIRLPVPRPAHSQPRSEALLRGLQELGKTAASEAKQLIFATSGLTGWLATSLGAAGFGAGTTPTTNTLAEPSHVPQPPEDPWPERPRYFEPLLLHTVDLATHHMLLTSKDYKPCTCRFCNELDVANPKREPSQWNRETAGLHHLLQLGQLLARLHTTNSQATARQIVEHALSFYRHLLPLPTHHDNQPRHLEAWAQLLQ
jgi:hypothetical protein